MSLSRTWYTAGNRALDDTSTSLRSHASMLFALKGLLTGDLTGTNGATGAPPSSSRWTVDASSDGATASAADNLGGATFTAAKWVRAAAGVAHSWFVLKSPASPGVTDGFWYLLVSLAGASDTSTTISISKNAFTGGTITADPTSTGQSTYTSQQSHPATTTAGKATMVIDAAGNFHFWCSKNSSGYAFFHMCGQSLVEARSSGDTGRFVLLVHFLDSSRGAPSWYASNVTWRGASSNAATAITGSTGRTLGMTFNGTALDGVALGTNAIDAKVDALPVCYIYDSTAGGLGFKGRIPDMWVTSAQAAVGACDPSSAAPERILLGGYMIPCGINHSF